MLTSWTRIRAIAAVRIRRVLRTRVALAALVMTLMPWLLVESPAVLPRLVSLAEFSLVGLTVLAAGAISDDLDSGEYAVLVTHDASPLEVLAGQAAASLALTAVLVAIQMPIALAGTAAPSLARLLQCIAWLGALLVAWVALMLLLATFLEGKANAVAMGALLVVVPLLAGSGLLDRLPGVIADAVRIALDCVPQVGHLTLMFRATLDNTPVGILPPVVLLVSPVLYSVLAAMRLRRLEPAGRLTQ